MIFLRSRRRVHCKVNRVKGTSTLGGIRMNKYRVTLVDGTSVYYMELEAEDVYLLFQRVLAALEKEGHEDHEVVAICKMWNHVGNC